MMNILFFFLLSLFWGGSFVAIKYVIAGVDPILGALLRVGFALVFIALAFAFQGKSVALPRADRWRVWLAGWFSLGLPFSLLFWSELHISPGLAGILNGTVPIWTAILAVLVFRRAEADSWQKKIGILFGMVGLLSIFVPQLTMSGTRNELLGSLAAVMMAVCYGLGALLTKRILSPPGGGDGVPLSTNLFHQHASALVYLVIVSWMFADFPTLSPWTPELSWALGATLYLALFSTAIAMALLYHLIRSWGPLRASSVTYVVPGISLLLDFWFYGTIPAWSEVGGLVLILSGVFLMQGPAKVLSVSQPVAAN